MHPDATIAALRRELEEAPERKDEIEAEIARVDAEPRPVAKPEEGETAADPRRSYLDSLERELKEAPERKDEIEAEIARVDAELSAEPSEAGKSAEEEDKVDEAEPSEEEIAQRKQARGGRKGKVEQARSAPDPSKAPPAETAPEGAKE